MLRASGSQIEPREVKPMAVRDLVRSSTGCRCLREEALTFLDLSAAITSFSLQAAA
jgi:hypothetical protein